MAVGRVGEGRRGAGDSGRVGEVVVREKRKGWGIVEEKPEEKGN